MKFHTAVITFVCTLLLIFTSIAAQRSSPPIFDTKSKENVNPKALELSQLQIAEGAERFALELWKQISDGYQNRPADASKNETAISYMLSPFAVWSLLLLLEEGAQNTTKEELHQTLHLNDDRQARREAYKKITKLLKEKTNTIEVASYQAIFTDINKPVKRDYENLINFVYDSHLFPVDFANVLSTLEQINSEVSKATRGLIPHILKPQDLTDAALIMMSALYFKGKWKYPFEADKTITAPFHDEQGKVLGNVQMMTQIGPFNYVMMKSMESYILELPYGKQNRLSMLIILPKKSVSLNGAIGNLRNTGVKSILNELAAVAAANGDEDIQDQVEVFLPRFSTSSHFSLRTPLTNMGIRDVFEPYFANLDDMAKNLFVGSIFQSTRIIVNEEGTEAAAATVAVLVNKASPTKFYVDRPFAYVIVEKSAGVLLFAGEVKSHLFN